MKYDNYILLLYIVFQIKSIQERDILKYGNDYYLQLSRHIFDERYKDLSVNAKWLYVVLNELKQRYVNNKSKDNWFFRSNEQLAEDSGLGITSVKLAKKELVESKLIQIAQMHFVDKETGKKSKKKITAYYIPRSEKRRYHELGIKEKPYLK